MEECEWYREADEAKPWRNLILKAAHQPAACRQADDDKYGECSPPAATCMNAMQTSEGGQHFPSAQSQQCDSYENPIHVLMKPYMYLPKSAVLAFHFFFMTFVGDCFPG